MSSTLRSCSTLLAAVLALAACSHDGSTHAAPSGSSPAASTPVAYTAQEVEAACGACQFGLTGKDCGLAVRIDGHAYYVDGAKIEGDAHAADGLCNAIRKARVTGTAEGERFAATSFELLPTAQ